MSTSVEFKHSLRLQLSDIEELIKDLKEDTPNVEAALEKLEKMRDIVLASLAD